jgi:hypothetical protein
MLVVKFVKEGKRYNVPPGTKLRKFALKYQIAVKADVKVLTRPSIEPEKELTKQRTILFGMFLGFGLVFFVMFGTIFLNLRKKF